MSVDRTSGSSPGQLKADIRGLEARLVQRHARLTATVGQTTSALHRQLLTPVTILGAALFGVALHRSRRLGGFKLLAILQPLNAGLRLLFTSIRAVQTN